MPSAGSPKKRASLRSLPRTPVLPPFWLRLLRLSPSVLLLFILALGLGLYLWLVEMPMERKRAHIETESKQLVNFKDSDVQSFTLHSAAGDLEVSRSDGDRAGTWTITRPRTMEADRQAVDQFLRTLILA